MQFLVSKNVAKPTLNQIKFAKNQKSRLTWNISSVLGNHSVSKVQTTGWSGFRSLENSLRNTTTDKNKSYICSCKAAVFILKCTSALSTFISLLNQLQMEHQTDKINTNANSFWPPYKNKFLLCPWPSETWCYLLTLELRPWHFALDLLTCLRRLALGLLTSEKLKQSLEQKVLVRS